MNTTSFGRSTWLFTVVAAFFPLLLAFATVSAQSPKAPVRIYMDADFTNSFQAGKSIEKGIRTALDEVGNTLAGRPVEVVLMDHRGNSNRSRANLERISRDPNALVVFAGLHSPPVLSNRDYINENQILMLDPWAAAGPITRPERGENWIFRLSVDDAKAGRVIARYAVKKRNAKHPCLLLENTGWGRSNQKTMTAALQELGIAAKDVRWFNWGIKAPEARILLRNIHASGADSVFLVANSPEAKVFARAMLDLPENDRLPIFSHWGLTGGDFPKVISAAMRKKLDLQFIQTNFTFLNNNSPMAQGVLARACRLFPELKNGCEMPAPAGFVHGYDLTRLLIAAAKQAGLDNSMAVNRNNVRRALEDLHTPVKGLLKTYTKPFGPYGANYPDAHEALHADDFVMGKYTANGRIELLGN